MAPGVILIAGPTASGKSALALALATRTGAAIVNADSMQVYRDLRVITARPSAGDEARADHRLYGVLDGAQRCSAGTFADLARGCLDDLARDGRPAVIVGGTGLYFRALTEGLSPVPEIGASAKAEVAGLMATHGADGLHAVLNDRDPAAAGGIRPSDLQRIQRALEVLIETGESLASWQARPGQPVIAADRIAARLVLSAPRAVLHERANTRFEAMIGAGALDEVAALGARDLDPALPVMKAVGVPDLLAYLAGHRTRAEAIADAQTATRRFIKRQETWFRHQMADWERIDAAALASGGLPDAAGDLAGRLGAY